MLLSTIHAKIERIEYELVDPKKPLLPNEVDSQIAELSIGVNQHLENIETIQETLFHLSVLGASDFCTDEALKFLKVAVSNKLPKNVVKKITEIALELGFE